MRKGLKGLVAGLAAALVASTAGLADAAACGRHADDCSSDAPPVAYRYAPPPAYAYGPPPAAYYAPPPGYYGATLEPPAPYAYGYRGTEDCDDDYAPSYAPQADHDPYRPAGMWVPAR